MEHYITNGAAKIWTYINDDSPNCTKPYLLMCGAGPGVNDGLSEVDPLVNMNFNTIRFNHRGCGSSATDGNYNMDTILDDIEAIRQFYRVESWYVLGHSWGANIALFYTIKHPQFCRSVVYLCGMGIQNDADWNDECAKNAAKGYNNAGEQVEFEEVYLRELANPFPRVFAEYTDTDHCDKEIWYEVLNAEIRSFYDYIKRPTLLKDIAALQVPVYVICGTKDISPMWPAVQLAHLLPMGELKILGECGHRPWQTHPDLFNKTIFIWFNITTV